MVEGTSPSRDKFPRPSLVGNASAKTFRLKQIARVADRPILFRGVENVHEHALRPDAGAFAEQLRDPPKQRFLLFRRAGVEHGDLDVHNIGAPGDAVRIT
jgi:hypothetical protein